jgi:succinate dehydrogenase hydrophobic anchor subunit
VKYEVSRKELERSDIYVRFVDILFAVVTGQSFALMTSASGYRDFFVSANPDFVGIATIFLVYGLVVTSWVGYHKSVKAYPILNPVRFVFDIMLLFFYYLAFASIREFNYLILEFFGAFVLYTLWDWVRMLEYLKRLASKKKREMRFRLLVSLVFALAFLALWYSYTAGYGESFGNGAYFVVMLLVVIAYRYEKLKFKTAAAIQPEIAQA